MESNALEQLHYLIYDNICIENVEIMVLALTNMRFRVFIHKSLIDYKTKLMKLKYIQ